MKIYEKSFARIAYSQEVRDGLFMSASLEYSERSPLVNNTNYVMFGNRNRSFTSTTHSSLTLMATGSGSWIEVSRNN